MGDRIGYLEEGCYGAEGRVLRHGDALRDGQADRDGRVLGMIGLCDAEAARSDVVEGRTPLARMIAMQDGSLAESGVCYGARGVKVDGLDTDLLDVRQAIRLEALGFTALTVITLRKDVSSDVSS